MITSPSYRRALGFVPIVVFIALVGSWLVPGSFGNWIFGIVFVGAFVLGPLSRRRKASLPTATVPKLSFKRDYRPLSTQQGTGGTKEFAQRIGFDG